MSKVIIAIVIGGVVIAGIILLLPGATPPAPEQPEQLGNLGTVPDLVLADYEGNAVRLGDFKGRVAVLNSWAVWCPFCRDELADFGRLQEEFKDEIVVVAIDRAESLEKAKGFTDSLGLPDKMVLLLDPGDSFYRGIGGFSMPETIFVDPAGHIRIHKRGPMDFNEMREKVLAVTAAQNQ